MESPSFLMITVVLILTFLLLAAVRLVGPIISPTIILYPWPLPDDKKEEQQRKQDKKKTVVLAGSYNPPHKGHQAMISYLAERYGNVIVAIGMNPNKRYDVTPQQRAELTRRMLDINNVQVQVIEGYIWRSVKRQGATLFFRGIRSWQVDGADERALQILNTWGPLVCGPFWWPLPTLYLQGKPEYNHVSSTLIRDICSSNKNKNSAAVTAANLPTTASRSINNNDNIDSDAVSRVAKLVPESIAKDVVKLYGGDSTKSH